MLVAVYHNNRDIRIENYPKPEIGPGEFLLKVMASGICGTDVVEWYRLPKAPRVLGHEVAGIIDEVGENVTSYKVGDRVFVSHHVPCNKCSYCLKNSHTACETLHTTNFDPGGFSQYIRVPKININSGVYNLPLDMSYDEGTFIEPLGCAVRGQRLANIKKSDTVLIIGSGIAGILHIQLTKLKKAQKVIAADINPDRLKMAKKFGADYVVNAKDDLPQQLKKLNDGKCVEKVLLCTGAPKAALTALDCVDRGGTILFFAVPAPTIKIPIPLTKFWRNETTIKTSYGAAPKDLKEALVILSKKKINVLDMITHRIDIREAKEGFRLVAEAGKSLKVIIEPNRN
ncbi:zinc-dependent dehydrogenase [Candidatus Bathyarchaeota archaeon]|nr:zinc-dependent dehydrogenase [Candidatus Bathyarchaeota archaeon]